MGKRIEDEMTMLVPGLTRSEARQMKRELIDMKQKVAPRARAEIRIGKKTNFDRIAKAAKKGIWG